MTLSPQRLIVTGGAGFIGSCFVDQMVQQGKEVLVIDALTYAGHMANLSWIEGKGSWRLEQVNIADGEALSPIFQSFKPDAVVNFAAESHVDNSITGSAVFIETNIVGTHRMLEATRHFWQSLEGEEKANFRYLQISTDEIFGSLELDSPEKFSESTQVQPSSPYSASKAAADHLVDAWFHTYGLPILRTNCTNNYGPRQHPEKLIPLMITHALAGKPLPVYGDGKNVRDWIHVEDHCRGVYLALTKGKIGENYCFGGNAEVPNIEVVQHICDNLQKLAPKQGGGSYRDQITFVQDRAGHDRRYAMDDSKALRELGYDRQYNFETGLAHTIQWYLNNEDWRNAVLATGLVKQKVG
jgi:dTDP-glucose 4,6-dehydratase